MNFKTIIKFILISSMFAVSCERYASDIIQSDMMTVTAGVAETRAGYVGTEVLPSEFILDIKQNSDSKYDYSTIKMVKGSGNRYTPADGQEMLWADKSHKNLDIKAMTIPAGLTGINPDSPMTITINSDQTSDNKVTECDILVCESAVSGDISLSGNSIALRFRHLLSKLEINYIFGAGLEADNVSFKKITLSDVCISGGFSYASMDFDDSISRTNGTIELFDDKSSKKLEALFIPFAPSSSPKLFIAATIAGTERTFTCDITPKTGNGFESGKCYSLSLYITNDSIRPTSVSISSGWDSQTEDKSFETE